MSGEAEWQVSTTEEDEGDEVIDISEPVGHSDGQLHFVIRCLHAGVGDAMLVRRENGRLVPLDFEVYAADADYQRSVSFSILQIGELSGGFSAQYRQATANRIQWGSMKDMRNLVAHN